VASLPTPSPVVRSRRALAALACAVVALVTAAVLPPLAVPPAVVAIVLGADARQRGLASGFRAHRMAAAALAVGALALAVGVALTAVALSGA
jgi:hypothetical protein